MLVLKWIIRIKVFVELWEFLEITIFMCILGYLIVILIIENIGIFLVPKFKLKYVLVNYRINERF